MSSEQEQTTQEKKKKRRCLGCQIPSQTKKIWLIPHILGFLCFMLVTYRTYEVGTVNEGVNTAFGNIQTTECDTCVKTFSQITNLEDTWAFLQTNVIPAIMDSDKDYNNINHLQNEQNNIDMQMRATTLPVTFLPISIEQKRDIVVPQCAGYMTKTEEEKKFVQATEGKCDTTKDADYLKRFKFGNTQNYNIETDATTKETTMVWYSEKCPNFVKQNFTYDPFTPVDSKLNPSSTQKVYTVENLSPRNKDFKSPKNVMSLLKGCRWTDLATRELFISIPFVVRGTGVFGAIQYTVQYSTSGTTSTQYRLAYAKHIETSEEYYANLNSNNVDDKNAALTSLFARVFMTIYLMLDIVLRNTKNIHAAFFKKLEVKKGENKIKIKLKAIFKAIFPGMNEYFSFFLLISALILPAFNANVNTQVSGLETLIAGLGDGTKDFDYKFSGEYNEYLIGAQNAMTFVKSFVVIIIAVWLAKLLIIFNNTEHVNIVPQTLMMSLPKILNLMIVILTMVGAFALMAMICYGHISKRWTSPLMMLLEVYSMMLGDYGDQYAEMYSNDRIIAIILFFYFSVILMMTLMNVFMSVVLDTYAEINSEEYQQKLVEAAEKDISMSELDNAPKKSSKCKRPKLPHRRSKWWLLPHVIGFLAYLNFVYRTYDLHEVNESMNAAKNYVSTSEGTYQVFQDESGDQVPKTSPGYKVKAFDNIASQNDVWDFLEFNLVPVMSYKMNSDFTGRNLLSRAGFYSPQNLLPFIFLPFQIEQYRNTEAPVCQGKTNKHKNYLKGIGVDCTIVNTRKFGEIPQPPGYNTTAYCPGIKVMNLTIDPFKGREPLLHSDKTKLAYRIADIAYYTKDYSHGMSNAVQTVIRELKKCYWFDLQTYEVQISVPFIAKGSGVFGNLQYSVEFSKSGVPSKRLLVNYARKTKTLTDDPIILACQLFVIFYLVVEIVLRNFYKIYTACCKKGSNIDEPKASCGKKVLKMILTFFPGIPEYIGMGLIFAIMAGFPIYINAINVPVQKMIVHIGEIATASENKLEDPEFSQKLSTMLLEAQTAQQTFNGFVLIVTGSFLIKMLLVFSETEHVDVVPLTLWKSLAPIWNLIIVIIAMMLAFAGIAMVLFGHIVHRWTNPFLMMLEVYQMMLGDWGDHYGEMYAQDRLMAILLFLFFSIVLMMTIVNIFLSVVLDTYSKVNEGDHEQQDAKAETNPTVTQIVPISTSKDPIAAVGDRLREARRMYGAGSQEYKNAVEDAKKTKEAIAKGAQKDTQVV